MLVGLRRWGWYVDYSLIGLRISNDLKIASLRLLRAADGLVVLMS